MALWKKAFALTLLTVLPVAGFADCAMAETWSGVTNGNWDVLTNWSPNTCVPGSVVTNTDTATFGSTVGAGPLISLDGVAIDPGLGQLTFDNASTSFTINSSGTHYLQFNGGTPLLEVLAGDHFISAHILLGATVAALDISASSGNLTLEQGLLTATGANLSYSGSGQLINQWNGNNVFNEFDLTMTGDLSISGGTFINSNNIAIPHTGMNGTSIVVNNIFVVDSQLMITNSGTVTGNAVGSSVSTFAGVTVTDGQLEVSNSGIVTGAVMQGEGSSLDMVTDLTINDGTLTNSNSGTIQNSGGLAGSIISTDGNINLTNSTFTNQNTGIVGDNCYGALISVVGNLNITSSTILNTNTGSVTGSGIGSSINVGTNIELNSGIFENNDVVQTALMHVQAAGKLTGTGVFQDFFGGSTTLVENGGTVIAGGPAIGSSPGSLLIRGQYTQSPEGKLVINLANPSSFSQLKVTGSAQLDGSLELALSPGASLADTDTYKILLAEGGVTGTFKEVINFDLGAFMPRLEYFPTYVLLSFMGPMTKATYLNYLEPLFSSINRINLRLDRQTAQLRQRFSRDRVEFKSVTALTEPEQLLVDNSPEITAHPQVEEKQQQLVERMASRHDQPWNIYFGPTGDVGRVLTQQDATGFHYDSIGAQAGFDYAFSRIGVGFLADYEHLDGRAAHKWGKFNINQAHGSLYVTYVRREEEQLAFNLILGGGYEWYRIHRNTMTGIARGTPQGVEFDALAAMEYTFEKQEFQGMPDHLQIVPLVNLQYIYLHVNDYLEHDAGMFNLHYRSQNARSLRSTLGTRINYSWRYTDVVFTPEINLAWQREYFDKSRRIGISAAGLASNLTLPRSGRNVALAGIDFLVTLFDTYGLEASYDFEWNTLYLDHFFYLGCNFRY